MENSNIYEYGSMSSKFQLEANNKLTAYSAMVFHYKNSAHLIAIYSPIECKEDSWLNPTGQISDRLDEIFGGENAFDEYVGNNIKEIEKSIKSIKRLI